jgi:hypothetical protein
LPYIQCSISGAIGSFSLYNVAWSNEYTVDGRNEYNVFEVHILFSALNSRLSLVVRVQFQLPKLPIVQRFSKHSKVENPSPNQPLLPTPSQTTMAWGLQFRVARHFLCALFFLFWSAPIAVIKYFLTFIWNHLGEFLWGLLSLGILLVGWWGTWNFGFRLNTEYWPQIGVQIGATVLNFVDLFAAFHQRIRQRTSDTLAWVNVSCTTGVFFWSCALLGIKETEESKKGIMYEHTDADVWLLVIATIDLYLALLIVWKTCSDCSRVPKQPPP